MKISMIVACGKNREIGFLGKIPWSLPEDLKHFKKLTLGHHILMGKTTFLSLGKPLPGRVNIVLSKDPQTKNKKDFEGAFVVSGLAEGVELAKRSHEEELFICGGAKVYLQAFDLAFSIHLSLVDYSGQADAFFPEIDMSQWEIKSDLPMQGQTLPWRYQILEKRNRK